MLRERNEKKKESEKKRQQKMGSAGGKHGRYLHETCSRTLISRNPAQTTFFLALMPQQENPRAATQNSILTIANFISNAKARTQNKRYNHDLAERYGRR